MNDATSINPARQIAIKLYKQQNYTLAIPIFLELLKHTLSDIRIESCFYLSLCYQALGQSSEQFDFLITSFQYDSPHPEICCQLGSYYMQKKEYDKAISWFQYALSCTNRTIGTFYLPEYWFSIPHSQLAICYQILQKDSLVAYHTEKASSPPAASSSPPGRDSSDTVNWDLELIKQQKEQLLLERQILQEKPKPYVSVILVTNKPDYLDTIFSNISRCSYPNKEFLILLNNPALSLAKYKQYAASYDNVSIYQLNDSMTLGDCLNWGIEHAKYDYIAKMDDDDYYGPNYLLDQMNLFSIPVIDVVTISNYFIEFEDDSHLYVVKGLGTRKEVSRGSGSTIVAKRSIFHDIHFESTNTAEDTAFFYDCMLHHFTVYSGSNFNYIYKRHTDLTKHTHCVSSDDIKLTAQKLTITGDFEALLTV